MYAFILFLHLLGAMIWTGGHLVLALAILPKVLATRDVAKLLDFEQAYERVGMTALAVQVITGIWMAANIQATSLSWIALDTPQAKLIAAKYFLLLITALTALDARLRVLPNLTAETLPKMAVRIAIVTTTSVLFVLVGASFRGWLLFGVL